MPDYIFAYHGGKTPESPEEGEKVMAAWNDWFRRLGSAVKQPGNPVGMSKTVSADGVANNGGANPLSGFTIVTAGDIDAACEMAKSCPILENETGSVEVAELIEM